MQPNIETNTKKVRAVFLSASDVFLTMVFQARRVLTIMPFGNADAVKSYKNDNSNVSRTILIMLSFFTRLLTALTLTRNAPSLETSLSVAVSSLVSLTPRCTQTLSALGPHTSLNVSTLFLSADATV